MKIGIVPPYGKFDTTDNFSDIYLDAEYPRTPDSPYLG